MGLMHFARSGLDQYTLAKREKIRPKDCRVDLVGDHPLILKLANIGFRFQFQTPLYLHLIRIQIRE